MKYAEKIISNLVDVNYLNNFVRNILGCQCPEDVFNDIVIGIPTVYHNKTENIIFQAVIGEKLFFSIVSLDSTQKNESTVRKHLNEGKKLRDINSLNRFRLVLIGEYSKDVKATMIKLLDDFDEKIHIHFVGEKELNNK